jgi:hypothetical protein
LFCFWMHVKGLCFAFFFSFWWVFLFQWKHEVYVKYLFILTMNCKEDTWVDINNVLEKIIHVCEVSLCVEIVLY